MNLFAYGTLMCDDIMAYVSGCRPVFEPVVLEGYVRRPVRDEPYPAVMPLEGANVEGMLFRDLPDRAWSPLDRFEGDMYLRQTVRLRLANGDGISAETYVAKPEYRHLLDDGEWDFDRFLREGKGRFRSEYEGFRTL